MLNLSRLKSLLGPSWAIAGAGAAAAGLIPLLHALKDLDYLLFHTVMEIGGVMVGAVAVLVIAALPDRGLSRPLAIIAGTSAGVGILDFLHAVSFADFPAFQGAPTADSVAFTVLARLLEAGGAVLAVLSARSDAAWPFHPARLMMLATTLLAICGIYAVLYESWLPGLLYAPGVGLSDVSQSLMGVAALALLVCVMSLARPGVRWRSDRRIGTALLGLFTVKLAYVSITLFGWDPVSTNSFIAHLLKAAGYAILAGTILRVGVLQPQRRLRDTREREQSLRAAVQDHADTLTAVIGASLDYLVIQDPEGRFLLVSPSVGRLFDLPLSRFPHATWTEIGLPAHPMRAFDQLRQSVLDSRRPLMQEGRLKVGGRSLDIEYQISPIFESRGGVQAIVTVGRDITDRKNAERRLRASLEENKILLAEVHHRVKNNLQVVSSILQMQAWTATNTAIRHQFEDAVGRILSLAKVHERLYQQDTFSRIDFGHYVQSLVGELSDLTGIRRRQIHLVVDIEPLQLTVDRAAPLALIVHELVTNSLKHAFDDRGGTISITFRHLTDQTGELSVSDTGAGLPAKALTNSPSLGMTILRMLTRQLRATLAWDTDHGTTARLTLPLTTRDASACARTYPDRAGAPAAARPDTTAPVRAEA